MKTICLAGHCCSGKTTAIDIMARNLKNSAVVHGDAFLLAALKSHAREFEEIYGVPFDAENPYRVFVQVNNDASELSVRTYLRFFRAFAPFIESEIEKAAAEKQQGRDFLLVEYVTLPIFRIWNHADHRILIASSKELRMKKLQERTTAKHGSYKYREGFHYLRENAFEGIFDAVDGVDFIVENEYDENFERDLIGLCQRITSF